VELERKFAPLIVNVCPAAPAVTAEGERPLMLGTEFCDCGAEELATPPTPHETQTAKEIDDRMQTIALRRADVACSDPFFWSPMQAHLPRA
jgi:hypothetical protein